MSKQDGFPALLEKWTSAEVNRGEHVRQAEPTERLDPVGLDPDRHQRRAGLDDRVAELPSESIAVTRSAAARVRHPADGQNQAPGSEHRSGHRDDKPPRRCLALSWRLDREDRALAAEHCARACKPPHERFEYVDGTVRDRKDLAVAFDLGCDALTLEQPHRLVDVKLPQGRAQKRASGTQSVLNGAAA